MRLSIRPKNSLYGLLIASGLLLAISAFLPGRRSANEAKPLTLQKGARICLLGNNLGSRMMSYDHF